VHYTYWESRERERGECITPTGNSTLKKMRLVKVFPPFWSYSGVETLAPPPLNIGVCPLFLTNPRKAPLPLFNSRSPSNKISIREALYGLTAFQKISIREALHGLKAFQKKFNSRSPLWAQSLSKQFQFE